MHCGESDAVRKAQPKRRQSQSQLERQSRLRRHDDGGQDETRRGQRQGEICARMRSLGGESQGDHGKCREREEGIYVQGLQ
jgi:hypothetical protein